MSVRACVCARVRASVCACVYARLCVCLCVYVRARARVCVGVYRSSGTPAWIKSVGEHAPRAREDASPAVYLARDGCELIHGSLFLSCV